MRHPIGQRRTPRFTTRGPLAHGVLAASLLLSCGNAIATEPAARAFAVVVDREARPEPDHAPGLPTETHLSGEVLNAISRLDALSFSERESAEHDLTMFAEESPEAHGLAGELGLATLERYLVEHAESLSPEARTRLARFASELYRRLPMSGMGMGPEGLDDGSVRINVIVPNFHIAEVLRVNDIIVSMGGQRLAGAQHMRALILSYRPGDPVEVEFLRAGVLQKGTVILGSFGDLANAGAIDHWLAREAWRSRMVRRARVITDELAPAGAARSPDEDPRTQTMLAGAIDASEWIDAGAVEPELSLDSDIGRVGFRDTRVTKLPLGLPTASDTLSIVDPYPGRARRPVSPSVWTRPSVRTMADREAERVGTEPDAFLDSLRAQLGQLRVMRSALSERLDSVRAQLEAQGLEPEQRARVPELVDAIERQMGVVDDQINRIRVQLEGR